MSFKEIACKLGTELDNEFIRIRADQLELGQKLTERINGVSDRVKILDGKVDVLGSRVSVLETKVDTLDTKVDALDIKVDRLDTKVDTLQGNQTEMMQILIAIQRKLDVN
jgi:outer membrane murein-binding lipoprotein Lpp